MDRSVGWLATTIQRGFRRFAASIICDPPGLEPWSERSLPGLVRAPGMETRQSTCPKEILAIDEPV